MIRFLIIMVIWVSLGVIFDDFLESIHHAFVAMFGSWFGYIWALLDNNNQKDK